MANQIQRLSLSGAFNTRDLGGLVMKDGRIIRKNRLIRSGQLFYLTEADLDILVHTHNLNYIVDFRTVAEQNEKPDPYMEGVTHLSNPIVEDMTAGITHDEDSEKLTLAEATLSLKKRGMDPAGYMKQMYTDIITSPYALSQYRSFFEVLNSHTSGAVLWHCSAGKDRVGIGTAMLLYTLGADMELIMEDYLATGEFVKRETEILLNELSNKIKNAEEIETIRTCMGVNADYLNSVFQIMEDTSGSISRFLDEKIGLTPVKREQLQTMYLE